MPDFQQVVWFDEKMDHLIYLDRDCNYRADRVDEFLTVLYAPSSDNLVGVKLKGIRAMYENLFEAHSRPDDNFVDFVDLIAGVMIWRIAHDGDIALMADDRRQEWRDKYKIARGFVLNKEMARVPRDLNQIKIAAN